MVGKTDDEQVEDLKRWWEKNGKFVILLLIAVIASVVGGRTWNDYKSGKSEAASAVFDNMVSAIREQDVEKIEQFGGDVIAKHADSQYAVMSALALAKTDIEKQEFDSALQRLEWALANASTAELQHVIRIRLARLQVGTDKADAALQLINSVEDPQAFKSMYAVIKGDALFAKGDKTAAVVEWQQAIEDSSLSPQLKNFVQMKLDDAGAGKAG
jgi:predicted negative regulator of RcsB-dependent stress response